MEIEWVNIEGKEQEIVNGWLSDSDKHNLCMSKKGWMQTAKDIEDCLRYMSNSQFKNLMGYVNEKPAVALMFGIEHGKILNLYNIVVNPVYRNKGVAKASVLKLLKNDRGLNITEQYKKVQVSALTDNLKMEALLTNLNFTSLGFNGEYVVFEKGVSKDREMV